MVKPNWNIFKAKFSENPQENFEWFCYLLFCKEYNLPKGIFRYKNQSAIETDPIKVGSKIIGWQAKFYTVSLSSKKQEILETVQKAKRDYPSITNLIFYINKEWGQVKGKEPKGKVDAEAEALKLGIKIEWQMTSFFESQFVAIDNKIISSYFFNESSLIDLSPKKGWYPYENWAHSPLGIKEEYIVSDKTVLYNEKNEEKPLIEGLNELRAKLLKEKSAIRLVGLSGVGKTRFVQAIFDERIGKNIPEASWVCYTDMSREPDPSPIIMIEQLLEVGERAIMIVDNCPPDLHRELVKSVGKDTSKISLLTVEYDVRDDLPDETDVFKLEPNDLKVIEKIIDNRFEYISQIDARSIAEFSGGNARVAIALANTIKKNETLSGLKDEELFKRLFEQRNSPNEYLLKSAEVLSLVYSFDGKNYDESSELHFLASLISKTALELYTDVQELKRRDLIQVRGDWRAVLPQAISNRLARKSIESLPKDYISTKFLESGSERLIKSFVHRLSFLHDSKNIREIVDDWLSIEGWLGKNNCNFNEFGMYVFHNIAPVTPKKILECIERVADSKGADFLDSEINKKSMEFVKILAHIAYEPKLFEKAVNLISRFTYFEKQIGKHNTIEETLKQLFWMTLSGTNASIEQRSNFINKLLNSKDENAQKLGFSLLTASLESGSFTSSKQFNFGARLRDFGWHPKLNTDVIQWYSAYLDICVNLVNSNHILSDKARDLLADKFRGLWNNSLCFDLLVSAAKQFHDYKPWIEGWLAVKEARSFDYEKYSPEIKEKIAELEEYLKPNTLYEKAKVFVLPGHHTLIEYNLDETHEDREKEQELLNQKCFEIGVKLSKNQDVFLSLLEEIICSDNYMLHILLQGIATGYTDSNKLWLLHYVKYKDALKSDRKLNATKALLFYYANNDLEYFNNLMNSLIDDEVFAENFPWLQTVYIDNDALQRLHKALDVGMATMWQYRSFAYGRNHENISDEDLTDLLKHIIAKNEGIDVVIEILSMRFHGKTNEKHSKILIDMAYHVLALNDYNKDDSSGSDDHNLETILKTCVNNLYNERHAEYICESLSKGIETSRISNYHKFLQLLSGTYPTQFLDIIFTDKFIDNYYSWSWSFAYSHKENYSILDSISSTELIKWCNKDPLKRYIFIAKIIYPLKTYEDSLIVKTIVYDLINNTSVLKDFLSELAKSIEPQSWSGSRADIIEKRLILFIELQKHDNHIVQKWAQEEHSKYIKIVKKNRKHEQERDEERYETFE